jgi:hypothetical protein
MDNKELLLKDLSARLPYEVKLKITLDLSYDTCYDTVEQSCTFNATLYGINIDGEPTDILIHHDNEDTANFLNENFQECPSILEDWIPYLRSMSSMTKEEEEEYNNIDNRAYSCPKDYAHIPAKDRIDWLLKNHFDFRGLIPKGLAIEVTKENNPYEIRSRE